jgi:hypothetical protein
MKHFLNKFSEQLKTHILYPGIFSETDPCDKKLVKFGNASQARDFNVTGGIVIPYWVNKSTETYSRRYCLIIVTNDNYSHVPHCYVVGTLRVFWHLSYLFVRIMLRN